MQERYQIVEKLYQQLKQKLATYPKVAMNNTTNSIPYTLNFSIEGIKSTDIQKKLEENDIYVSTKTSCCPIMTPSKLVYALTKDKNKASSSIRVSLSHLTTQQEIEIFISTFDKIYQKGEQNGKI